MPGESQDGPSPEGGHPPYPVGLRLAGRRVVVVGGGHVAQRRVPALIAAGADVLLVSPQVTPALEGLAGEITWEQRRFEHRVRDRSPREWPTGSGGCRG